MTAADALGECRIVLADAPPVDAFGLAVTIDAEPALATVTADGPGIFRATRAPCDPPFARPGTLLPRGAIVGFVQRGVLVLPLTLPEPGHPIAFAPEGARVEYGSPVVRYIRALEAITP